MNELKNALKRVALASYQFEFHKHNLHVVSAIFIKSISDFYQLNTYHEYFLKSVEASNPGEDLDNKIKSLDGFNIYEIPSFAELPGGLAKAILLAIKDFDFYNSKLFYEDVLSSIYEFLGQLFFKSSPNKWAEEFLTPKSLCDVMAQLLTGKPGGDGEPVTINDPCCGTGSTLVSFIMQNYNTDVTVTGQDINANSVKICRMNIALHQMKAGILKARENKSQRI